DVGRLVGRKPRDTRAVEVAQAQLVHIEEHVQVRTKVDTGVLVATIGKRVEADQRLAGNGGEFVIIQGLHCRRAGANKQRTTDKAQQAPGFRGMHSGLPWSRGISECSTIEITDAEAANP